MRKGNEMQATDYIMWLQRNATFIEYRSHAGLLTELYVTLPRFKAWMLMNMPEDKKAQWAWMQTHITYVKHSDTLDASAYWPHVQGLPVYNPAFVGLSLAEYIEQQIVLRQVKQQEQKAANYIQWLYENATYVETTNGSIQFHYNLSKEDWLNTILPKKFLSRDNAQMWQWLVEHVKYLEHGAYEERTLYWPQQTFFMHHEPRLLNMSLETYISIRMQEAEKNRAWIA